MERGIIFLFEMIIHHMKDSSKTENVTEKEHSNQVIYHILKANIKMARKMVLEYNNLKLDRNI